MRYGTGATLIILAGVIWSVQGLIIRNIDEAGSWAILFWRSAGMVPVLAIWTFVAARGSVLTELRRVGMAGVLGALGLVVAFGGAIYSFQATTVANAVLLFAASPFLAAMLGWLVLGEKVAPLTWAAIALAILGIGVMVGGGMAGGRLDGNLAALLSAGGFAVFTVTLRWGKLTNMVPAVLLGGLFSMVVGFAVATALGQPVAVPLHDILISLAMGAVTLSGGMLLYTLGSRVVPAAQSTLMSLIEVLLAPIWVWLFLGEVTTQNTMIGGAVLLFAVLLNAYSGRPGAAARNPALAMMPKEPGSAIKRL